MVVAYKRPRFTDDTVSGTKICLKVITTATSGTNSYGSFSDKDSAISMELSLAQMKGLLAVLTGAQNDYQAEIIRPRVPKKTFTIKSQPNSRIPYHVTMRGNGLFHSISLQSEDAWSILMVATRVLKELHPGKSEPFLLDTFLQYA